MRMTGYAAVAALLLAAAAQAQVPGYPNGCAKCGVTSFVDLPAQGATIDAGAVYLAGWGFECEAGAAVDRVDVFYEGDDGFFVPAGGAGSHGNGELYDRLWRPDVIRAYQAHCPKLLAGTGWHFYFTKPLPRGTRKLVINTWRGAYFVTHTRTVTVR